MFDELIENDVFGFPGIVKSRKAQEARDKLDEDAEREGLAMERHAIWTFRSKIYDAD